MDKSHIDHLQFGFKSRTSTNHALYALKSTVSHFNGKGSSVRGVFGLYKSFRLHISLWFVHKIDLKKIASLYTFVPYLLVHEHDM